MDIDKQVEEIFTEDFGNVNVATEPQTENQNEIPTVKTGPTDLGQVFKSPLDPRKYSALQLPNGLKVLLISTIAVSKNVPKTSGGRSCNLKNVMRFNKSCLGLDDKTVKIRCECMARAPTMLDKATSTTTMEQETNGTQLTDEEARLRSSMSLVATLNAIKALIYGDDYTNDLEDETTTSQTTTDSGEDDDSLTDSQIAIAFLSVGAGWFNDPDDMPGMAHFVEHCFFLGSKLFPYPNQLFRLILPHDGYTNAYTTGYQTVYNISTSLEIYALALEMLADAIRAPLLPRDLVAKEIDAMDAEFSLRQDDMPKYYQLLASLTKEGHPMRRMDTGNKETLRIPGFYRKMLEWRTAHYAANYMTLCLEAPLSIFELEELATKYFSDIPSSKLPSPRSRIHLAGSPFDMKDFHKIYHVPSIYHSEFMAIHWTLDPGGWKNLSVKPLQYIGAVISSKEEGGLYQFLNFFGWANNINAGSWDSDIFCNHYTAIFTIYVDITDEGFSKQEYILQAVFAYIEMLAQRESSQSFFQELQKQQADYFHHRAARETASYCEDASYWLHNVPAQFVLAAPQLITKYDPELISNYTKMLTFDTCNIMVFSKTYFESEKMNNIEKYYQTPYSAQPFPEELGEKIKIILPQLSQAFHFPKPNIYLQEIMCCGSRQKNLVRNGPLMIVKGKCSIYYKDKHFKTVRGQLPQAKYVFWLHSPVMNTGPKATTMMELFANFINEMIESRFCSALTAHFHIHAKVTPGKLELSLTGPSSQLPQVTKDLFKTIIIFEKLLDPTTFNIGKKLFMESLDNISLENRVHAWDVMNFLWVNQYQLSSEHIHQTEKIDYDTFTQFIKKLKKKVYIANHLHGFITIEQAFHVVQTVSNFMRTYPKEVKPQEIHAIQCPQLPIGENIIKVKSKNTRTHTSVIINGYQFGHLGTQDNKIVDFLAKCMSDTAYNQLRTVEQLGYIVLVYHDQVFSITSLFMELVTQPKNFTTEYCNSRMDDFVSEFYKNYLSGEEKFSNFMQGKPKIDFELKSIQQVYQRYLLPNTDHFRKLSVQVVGSLLDAFVISQKAELGTTPNIYIPFSKPETYAYAIVGAIGSNRNIGKSKSNVFAKTTVTNKRYADAVTELDSQKNKTKFKPKAVGKSRSQSSRYGTSKKADAVRGGDQSQNVGPKKFSRLVRDIHEFKDGLQLYPNHTTFKIDSENSFFDYDDDEIGTVGPD